MSKEGPTRMDWSRQVGEPNDWYGKFHIFLILGVGRSLTKAYNAWRQMHGKKPDQKTPPGVWRTTAKRWHWKERAALHDAAQREKELAAHEAQLKEFNAKLFGLANKMLDKGDGILDLPHKRTVTAERDGKLITVIEPVNFRMSDANNLIQDGAKLGKQVLEPDRPDATLRLEKVEEKPEHEAAHDWLTELEDEDDKSGNADGKASG